VPRAPHTALHGLEPLPGTSNYFRAGAHPLTLTDVPTYAAVSQDVAPGVSVVYHGNGPNLPFDLQIAAGGKLCRLPLPLAEAFLSSLTARLRPLFPAGLYRTALPVSLAGLAVVVLDGKTIKKAAKRLLATRGQPGRLCGGKILAAYLPAEGL